MLHCYVNVGIRDIIWTIRLCGMFLIREGDFSFVIYEEIIKQKETKF